MKSSLILLRNTPEDLWAAPTKDPAARVLLRSLVPLNQSDSPPLFRVLIAYPDQLHDFVRMIPSLAWELLEYAREPLEIVYFQKKDHVKTPDNSDKICVRWVKQPVLLRFLQKHGPHWAGPTSLFATAPEPNTYITKDCYSKQYPYRAVRTMTISSDDTFSFIH